MTEFKKEDVHLAVRAELVKSLWTYKGNTYRIEQVALMKDPNTRQWISCIIYRRRFRKACDDSSYVRESNDFFDKFTESKS